MSWIAIARKDLRTEWRSRETLIPLILTGLLVVTVGLLGLHDVEDRTDVGASILWMGLAFATGVGLARAFGAEHDRGTLDTLLILPIERSSVYLGKVAAAFAALLTTAFIIALAYAAASGDAVSASWPWLVPIVMLGALGLAAAGTMMSMLAARTRGRETLLPVLLFPLLIPLLLSTIHASQSVLRGEDFASWRGSALVLVGYDIVVVAASAMLFEEATR